MCDDDSEEDKLHQMLDDAIKSDDINLVHDLVNNENVDINRRDISLDLQTILMKICYMTGPEVEIVKVLHEIIERDPDVNSQDSHGRTAMMHACISGQCEVTDVLVSDPETRIDICDFDGNSVLIHAIKSGKYAIVKRILDHPGGFNLLLVYNSNGKHFILLDWGLTSL